MQIDVGPKSRETRCADRERHHGRSLRVGKFGTVKPIRLAAVVFTLVKEYVDVHWPSLRSKYQN